jgi:CDP-paratose 2-epimerase
MRVIIVTGSAGLVGSECVNFFTKKGFLVIGIDNNMRNFFFGSSASIQKNKKKLIKNQNYIHYNIDIRNTEKLGKIFKKYSKKIFAIIHAAAQPSHDWAYKDPLSDFDINARATLNLLMLYKQYSKKASFIFLSTNKVYGDNPNLIKLKIKKNRFIPKFRKFFSSGFDETLSTDNCIHSFFGSSKLYADAIVQEFGKNFKLNTVCFRAGCITGPEHAGAELHGFLSYLVKTAAKEKKYKIFGYDGFQVRDNIHSKDLIDCFWEYLKKPREGEVYNIGGGSSCSISINEALSYLEKKLKIKVQKFFLNKPRTGDHLWYVTNFRKFKKHYPNWKQNYNIKKILDELIFSLK